MIFPSSARSIRCPKDQDRDRRRHDKIEHEPKKLSRIVQQLPQPRRHFGMVAAPSATDRLARPAIFDLERFLAGCALEANHCCIPRKNTLMHSIFSGHRGDSQAKKDEKNRMLIARRRYLIIPHQVTGAGSRSEASLPNKKRAVHGWLPATHGTRGFTK